jgi:glutamate dehydrogenase (NAD(P)+)
MRYGRLEKRIDHAKRETLVQAIEDAALVEFDEETRSSLVRGTDELDLVNSGLEETLITAFQEIVEIQRRHKKIEDLRTAAYVSAIQKVGVAYLELGVFP